MASLEDRVSALEKEVAALKLQLQDGGNVQMKDVLIQLSAFTSLAESTENQP